MQSSALNRSMDNDASSVVRDKEDSAPDEIDGEDDTAADISADNTSGDNTAGSTAHNTKTTHDETKHNGTRRDDNKELVILGYNRCMIVDVYAEGCKRSLKANLKRQKLWHRIN